MHSSVTSSTRSETAVSVEAAPRLRLLEPVTEFPDASPAIMRPSAIQAGLKRALDVFVAATLLMLLVPVVAIASIAVLIDSPGPLFFRSERVGYRGRRLRMLKFRKMHPNADSGPGITVDDDERFTRVGVWLARLKIDEIPQLWHVLRGEMSLVGPRPEDPRFVERHPEDYHRVLGVRPGITGLSQLAFAEESRILDDEAPLEHYMGRILPQKLGLDKMYAETYTIWFDLRILLWTVVAVIMRRRVAVHRHSGRLNLRRR
jgi:lipopolysaccharide/colanic/teichoic acid biosynthesis glycosyltransferase